jgi:hypothetical protein
MEIFAIGSLTTLLAIAIINKRKAENRKRMYFMRQSTLYKVIKTIAPQTIEARIKKDTQSQFHKNKSVVRVLQAPNNKAYWVKDNIFYSADIINGEFDPTAGTPVDTINASKKELETLMVILDNLKNG